VEGKRPREDSPRYQAVLAARLQLERHARELGASDVCLTGSVARGEDHDGSDIDFWVEGFDGDEMTARQRTTEVVRAFREILQPYAVDIRGDYFPGWLVDAPQASAMRRDAIRLADLEYYP
jgi:predicted nucleotidyltransferase